MTTLQEVYALIQNNDEFRKAFYKDPIFACEKYNLNLSQENLQKISSKNKFDPSKNGKLDDRIIK